MIIAFEGGDGAGKGTQVSMLAQTLANLGHEITCIIEPGGTPVGQAIREVLLHRRDLNILGITEAFLFSASRAQQIREVVRPALQEGRIVIADRSFWSTFAYQGHARRGDLDSLAELTDIAVGSTRPALVILLDAPYKVGLARKKDQNEINRLDAETMEFHRKVREGYLELARLDSETWTVIDATLSPEEIHEQVLNTVLNKLS